MLIFLFRHQIPYSFGFFLGGLGTLVVPALIWPTLSTEAICAVGGPAVAYLTVFIGLTRLPRLPLFSRGDYSYGIYLYGYPVQQALMVIFPSLTSPWLHYMVTLPIVIGVAMVSWHVIEKPVLALRKRFSFTARKGSDAAGLPDTLAAIRPPE